MLAFEELRWSGKEGTERRNIFYAGKWNKRKIFFFLFSSRGFLVILVGFSGLLKLVGWNQLKTSMERRKIKIVSLGFVSEVGIEKLVFTSTQHLLLCAPKACIRLLQKNPSFYSQNSKFRCNHKKIIHYIQNKKMNENLFNFYACSRWLWKLPLQAPTPSLTSLHDEPRCYQEK